MAGRQAPGDDQRPSLFWRWVGADTGQWQWIFRGRDCTSAKISGLVVRVTHWSLLAAGESSYSGDTAQCELEVQPQRLLAQHA